MKKILITGANSYIGTSFEKYMKENHPNEYQIDTLDMKDSNWKNHDFSMYETVFHVAGIAHADVGKVSEETKQLYYKVNTELTIEVAEKAKKENVKQFIFMSSMIVYSGTGETVISRNTVPKAENFYGDSKLQADLGIQKLNDDNFKVCILRPPMIYGPGSKGNYRLLSKYAKKLPIFPNINNNRSMLYVENLCEFIRLMIDNKEVGVFFPQNREYVNTCSMVKEIAKSGNHKIFLVYGFNTVIKIIMKSHGKMSSFVNKAFKDSIYEAKMSEYDGGNYQKIDFLCSIKRTEEI